MTGTLWSFTGNPHLSLPLASLASGYTEQHGQWRNQRLCVLWRALSLAVHASKRVGWTGLTSTLCVCVCVMMMKGKGRRRRVGTRRSVCQWNQHLF